MKNFAVATESEKSKKLHAEIERSKKQIAVILVSYLFRCHKLPGPISACWSTVQCCSEGELLATCADFTYSGIEPFRK